MSINEFIPYGKHYINKDDIEAVVSVLQSEFITQGPTIESFENSFANKVGVNYATAVNSATSALHITCLALGLGKGDWLWTSSITFVASANCALYCGAKVDFVDIDLATGLLSIDSLERKLEKAEILGQLPKIIMPVHLGGSSCDMQSILKLSKKYKFKIIEDASHALGGRYKDSYVGSCEYSDATIFSLHPVKIITSGEGGVITTKSKKLDKKVKMLRSHGITKDRDSFIINDQPPWAYEQQDLGFNYRMTDIHAALGLSQLSRVEEIVRKRNSIRSFYFSELEKANLEFIVIPEHTYSSNHLFIVMIKDCKELKKMHIKVFNSMRKKNVGVQIHYAPVHLQPFYQKMGFKYGDFPNSEKYAEKALSLPIYPELKNEEIKYISKSLISILEDNYS